MRAKNTAQAERCPLFIAQNKVSTMRTHDYCIILAGGVGRRLWPASREQRPKQFIDFFGVGRTLLQLTYDRFAAILPPQNIYISTFANYEQLVRDQLPMLTDEQILIEPVQLSTGPAAAWASWHIAQRDNEACIVTTPADQLITGEVAFAREIAEGLDFVRESRQFLAMSVKAATPMTAYGYIQKGESLAGHRYQVKSFTEKPPLEFARTFVESGEFLWNTGLFLWAVGTMCREFERLIPGLVHADVMVSTREEEQALIARCYPAAEFRTLDAVALEGDVPAVVQECTFGWRDVGSWPVMKEALEGDVDGNARIGGAGVVFQATQNTLICLPEGVGAVVRGLNDYLVALEGNMLLITPNDDASRPRHLTTEVQVKLGESFL